MLRTAMGFGRFQRLTNPHLRRTIPLRIGPSQLHINRRVARLPLHIRVIVTKCRFAVQPRPFENFRTPQISCFAANVEGSCIQKLSAVHRPMTRRSSVTNPEQDAAVRIESRS